MEQSRAVVGQEWSKVGQWWDRSGAKSKQSIEPVIHLPFVVYSGTPLNGHHNITDNSESLKMCFHLLQYLSNP